MPPSLFSKIGGNLPENVKPVDAAGGLNAGDC